METIKVGQVYQDRDFRNAVMVWGPEVNYTRECVGINMRQVKVMSVSDDYVLVECVVGKRPGARTRLRKLALLGKSRSQGFDLVEES